MNTSLFISLPIFGSSTFFYMSSFCFTNHTREGKLKKQKTVKFCENIPF